MRTWISLWVLVGLAATSSADLLSYSNQLPECGVNCIASAIPNSVCRTIANWTCVCTDPQLYDAVQDCLAVNCNAIESLTVSNIEAKACNKPVRSRKRDLLIPLVIEVPGFICVWLRLISRWTTVGRFEVDDYVILVCGILYTVFVVLGQTTGALAFGVDIWTVSPDTITLGLKLFYIDESFYLVCLALAKVSILFFYLRIFPNRWFRYAALTVMGFIIFSGTIILFLEIFQCMPVYYVWDGWKGDFGPHQCLDVNLLTYVAASCSITQDIIILVLPLPLLYKLNTSTKSKVAITVMFSLGIFILITSCIRLRYIILFARSSNPTWDYTDPLIWSGLEVSVSMIVTSLPAIRVLLARVLPTVFNTLIGRSKGDSKEADLSSSAEITKSKLSSKSMPRLWSAKRATLFPPTSWNMEDDQNESQLELGDKMGGDVQTKIGIERGTRIQRGSEEGIHVQTTTTRVTDRNEGVEKSFRRANFDDRSDALSYVLA